MMTRSERSMLHRTLVSVRFWGIAYVVMLVAIMSGFFHFRSWASQTYATEKARVQWEQWRDDVKNQPDSAPVKRRVPKSVHPPATVLLFDYFWTCVSVAIVLSSVLFLLFMFVTRGVVLSPGKIHD